MKYIFILVSLALFGVLLYPISDDKLVEDFAIQTHFCPKENCTQIMMHTLQTATESVNCAFYDLKSKDILETLNTLHETIPVKLVVHERVESKNIPTVQRYKGGLMHHKFCIIDQKIILTGSANPTAKGLTQNNNNVIIINSTYLAQNFQNEFNEMFFHYKFGEGSPAIHDIIHNSNGSSIKTVFCPQSQCEDTILSHIQSANSSIDFLAFTFTSIPIANQLIIASLENVTIRGIFEKRQRSQYWQFERVSPYFKVALFQSPVVGGILHQKVFIIDNSTLLVGSYNPTKAANTINDEVILIIQNHSIVSEFNAEFAQYWREYTEFPTEG